MCVILCYDGTWERDLRGQSVSFLCFTHVKKMLSRLMRKQVDTTRLSSRDDDVDDVDTGEAREDDANIKQCDTGATGELLTKIT